MAEVKEGATANDLFGFLTTEPNAEVNAIHPTAMPVILTTEAEVETWLTAPTKDALALQRPLPDGALKIGAREERRRRGREVAPPDLIVVSSHPASLVSTLSCPSRLAV